MVNNFFCSSCDFKNLFLKLPLWKRLLVMRLSWMPLIATSATIKEFLKASAERRNEFSNALGLTFSCRFLHKVSSNFRNTLLWVLAAFGHSFMTAFGKISNVGKCLHRSSWKQNILKYLWNHKLIHCKNHKPSYRKYWLNFLDPKIWSNI